MIKFLYIGQPDVDAAAYGEYIAGHGQGYSLVVYYTVGTGVGGGVMKQVHLQKKIHHEFTKIMNNYVDLPKLEKYIVFPKLIDQAGAVGCLGLAKEIASV